MRIDAIRAWAFDAPLTRPYAISGGSWHSVEMAFVALRTDAGVEGFGMASPATEVTGETRADSLRELEGAGWLASRDAGDTALLAELDSRVRGPAARSALDMALCDLIAKKQNLPLAELFSRKHASMPTSVTIGVKPVVETLAEAREYVERGFTALKVKVGASLEEDIDRLTFLRIEFGDSITVRADANQGYSERDLVEFLDETQDLGIEMIEQPLPPGHEGFLRTLPLSAQRLLCADESVHDEAALARLVAEGCPYGIVNVKLQKCGGPRAALRIARMCQEHGLGIMWGCNDESALGIAAALHTAFACDATRFLDLDGSLDLAKDAFSGGFTIRNGRMSTMLRPGLGCELEQG